MDKNIFTKNHVLLDIECKTQKEVFERIAEKAFALKIIDNKKSLVDGLVKREQNSTTGLKEGFAIPHTMNGVGKKAGIIAVRLKGNGVDWKSYDGKPVKFIICLLIPSENLSDLHMKYLTNVSSALMDEKFCKDVMISKGLDKTYALVSSYVNKKEVKSVSAKKPTTKTSKIKRKNFIVVSACATGVAHTFMVRDAMKKLASEIGYNCHAETNGQIGRENEATKEIIAKADFVIISSDIEVDADRFIGKPVYFCDTNASINDPKGTLAKAEAVKIPYAGKTSTNSTTKSNGDFLSADGLSGGNKFKTFMKHFLSGVSKMIPFIVFSGIVWSIINAIAMFMYPEAYDPGVNTNEFIQAANQALYIALQASQVGFTLFIAIMGGFIAESIAGRAALGPGMISTFIAASSSFYYDWNGVIPSEVQIGSYSAISGLGLSIFAALLMGFGAGMLVKQMLKIKVPNTFKAMMPIVIIPVIATSALVFPFIFIFSGPLGYLMNGFGACLAAAGSINGLNFVIGFVLGAMIGFDMGGPINKIAGATATALITIDPRLMGAVSAAIPVAPIGCGIATLIGRRYFDANERSLGITALGLGFVGISEGAIPFAAKRPKQVIISNVIGSAIAGGLAFLFYVGGYVGMWGGPIVAITLGIHAPVDLMNVPSIFGAGAGYISVLWFFLAIVAGSLIQATIFLTFLAHEKGTLKIFTSLKNKLSNSKTKNK